MMYAIALLAIAIIGWLIIELIERSRLKAAATRHSPVLLTYDRYREGVRVTRVNRIKFYR